MLNAAPRMSTKTPRNALRRSNQILKMRMSWVVVRSSGCWEAALHFVTVYVAVLMVHSGSAQSFFCGLGLVGACVYQSLFAGEARLYALLELGG